MTSDRIFVWGWPPGRQAPTPMGVLTRRPGAFWFTYARSWLERPDAIALYGIELDSAPQFPQDSMALHGSIRDALPDAWGQRVIAASALGRRGRDLDTGSIDLSTYMLESGSDRFGAIDFQRDAAVYQARTTGSASVTDLAEAASALEEGRPVAPAVSQAFEHGTSVGGARPKLTVGDEHGSWIVKLSSSTDHRPVIRLEGLAMDLARAAGIDVPDTKLERIAGRDCLWVRRFDRADNGSRIMAVSGLTLCGLDESVGRYATYPDIVDKLREHGSGVDPGPQVFERVAFNMLVGNVDDHARNHAALWDGSRLSLSPAYDLDPCRPAGWDANQAMAFGPGGERESNLALLISCAATYGLTQSAATERVQALRASVEDNWAWAAERNRITATESSAVKGSILLAPGPLDGLPGRVVSTGFTAPPAPATSTSGSDVWVAPHVRGGRPVAGHWRRRR